jgi:hypothetical protein
MCQGPPGKVSAAGAGSEPRTARRESLRAATGMRTVSVLLTCPRRAETTCTGTPAPRASEAWVWVELVPFERPSEAVQVETCFTVVTTGRIASTALIWISKYG